eukprot:13639278-Alexandrium_andersonii.AAC.1
MWAQRTFEWDGDDPLAGAAASSRWTAPRPAAHGRAARASVERDELASATPQGRRAKSKDELAAAS